MDTTRTHCCLISLLLVGLLIAGCGGGSGGGGDNGGGGGNTPPSYTVSGTIQPALSNGVDADVNDVNAINLSNNTSDSAQPIPNPVIVGGHTNLPYSGPTGQTYAGGDTYDWYRVTLAANQTIILSIAEDGLFNDLDLFLYGTVDLQNPVDESLGTERVESLTVKQAGDYFIVVKAYSGASNYTLTVGQLSSSSGQDTGMRLSAPFVPGQVIARFSDKVPTSGQGLQARARSLGLDPVMGEEGRSMLLELPRNLERMYQVLGVTAKTPDPDDFPSIADPILKRKHDTLIASKELRKHSNAIAVAPNFIRRAEAVFTPNDEFYPLQWNYPLINLPYAWGLNSGANTIVAVIDTGIVKEHPDLQGQLLLGYDFIQDSGNAGDGGGIDPDPADPGDRVNPGETSSFHGTHVAGTVAALTNNGIGVAGVAFSSKIMPLRVLGRYGGTDYDIEQAVLYAAGLPNDSNTVPPKRADVINLSLGGPGYSATSQAVFNQARNAGVVIVAAAGNEASNDPSYPAAYDGVIAVSAVTIAKTLAPYSNYGSYVDVAAPGGHTALDLNGDGQPDGVLSTAATDANDKIVPNYLSYQGTSMASPHMAGVVALMRSVNPGLTPADIDSLLAGGRITMDLGDPGRDDLYGYGLINAYTAVLAAGAPGTPEPILSVNPAALNFGLFIESIIIKVENSGVGDLKVDAVIPSADWLSVTPVAIDANGLGDYKVTANRANLADGVYTARITFSSATAGTTTVQVPVIMQIASLGASNVGTLYVLAVDAASGNVIQGTMATRQSNGTYRYSLSEVPKGKYQIFAGTDSNNDNVICDSGEACGAYLILDTPITTEVNGDRQVPSFNVGFSTNLQNTSSSGTSQGIQGLSRNPSNGKELRKK
ncbi:MAG: S8 family serine peptidase [Candidatus Competibacteraceae bacterium]